MRLRTAVGPVELQVLHGQDPQDRHWGCPLREQWGLRPGQTLSPLLEDRLCFLATATGSYEEAAAVASKWGVAVDDSTLHALGQQVGERAEVLGAQRRAPPAADCEPSRAPADPLVLMIDGWQVPRSLRQRAGGRTGAHRRARKMRFGSSGTS